MHPLSYPSTYPSPHPYSHPFILLIHRPIYVPSHPSLHLHSDPIIYLFSQSSTHLSAYLLILHTYSSVHMLFHMFIHLYPSIFPSMLLSSPILTFSSCSLIYFCSLNTLSPLSSQGRCTHCPLSPWKVLTSVFHMTTPVHPSDL